MKRKTIFYDYQNQAWIENGRYARCGHPESTECGCYGRQHEGEPATHETLETIAQQIADAVFARRIRVTR